MFVLYDIERSFDERVCRNFQDVRETITGADLAHFTVVEFDVDDGTCRDITDLFVLAEDADEPEDDRPINHTAAMRRAGAFSR